MDQANDVLRNLSSALLTSGPPYINSDSIRYTSVKKRKLSDRTAAPAKKSAIEKAFKPDTMHHPYSPPDLLGS